MGVSLPACDAPTVYFCASSVEGNISFHHTRRFKYLLSRLPPRTAALEYDGISYGRNSRACDQKSMILAGASSLDSAAANQRNALLSLPLLPGSCSPSKLNMVTRNITVMRIAT
jgi:hypothetical protein